MFETTSPKYDWLNHMVAIGLGTITKKGVRYKIYAIKKVQLAAHNKGDCYFAGSNVNPHLLYISSSTPFPLGFITNWK